MPVGKFSPFLKTEIVKPDGRTMSSPRSGLNSAVLSGQMGLTTVAATASAGSMNDSKNANLKLSTHERDCMRRSILSPKGSVRFIQLGRQAADEGDRGRAGQSLPPQ